MRVGDYLWDFVGTSAQICRLESGRRANPCAFMRVLYCEFPITCWHTICSLVGNVVTQDWLPGVAETQPRLGFGFWGVSSKERGGLHQPPFSFSGCESLGWLVRGPVGDPVSLK